MNISKGNMYGFVTHTWNPIKGRCSHDCSYCYMKRWGKLSELRLDQAELADDLSDGNFIFVGSSTDMFAEDVPFNWIARVLAKCRRHPGNRYLFQSKNPWRMVKFYRLGLIPLFKIPTLGTTIETNRNGYAYRADEQLNRVIAMSSVIGANTLITIEPVIDFDTHTMLDWMAKINPSMIAVGADTRRCGLDEPSKEKLSEFISALREKQYNVHIKDNLKRLM